MRRRHPDERCGLCEAAPFRVCRGTLPGFWHFQPAGFRPELPTQHRAKSSGRLAVPFQQTPRAVLVAALDKFVSSIAPQGQDISGIVVVAQRRASDNGVYERIAGVWRRQGPRTTAPSWDSILRSKLSAARAAGKLGAR